MQLPTRRSVLKAGIGAVTVAAAPLSHRNSRAFAQAAVASRALGGSLHLLTAAGVNSVVQAAAAGTLMVDGGSTATSGAILEAVSMLPDAGNVQTLFNTHWHPEQTGSNVALGEAGATIIAQENTRLWLTTEIVYPWDETQRFEPLPAVGRPNSSFFDTGELPSGVQYGYLRHAGHTDGDLYVYFPEQNVLAVGDTVSGDGWPFIDWWTGGWIGGVVGTLELILYLMDQDTRVIPARGPVLTRPEIEAQFEMYNTIYNRLATMINDGYGADEAIEMMPTAEYDASMGPPETFVRRAFESLWAYLSPDA